MKVNGYYGYGSFQELRDFNLVDHNGIVFTKENLKEHSLNFFYTSGIQAVRQNAL